MPTNKIKIVYSCNDAMFEAIYLSILSIVSRTKSPISFYLISADLSYLKPTYNIFSKFHEQIIDSMVKSFNSNNEFKVVDATKKIFYYFDKKIIERKNYASPFALLRTLIFCFNWFSGDILYLDADTMANNDIAEFFNINTKGHEFFACRDYVLKFKYFKKYYNSGVMLFNANEVKKTKLLLKVINFINNNKTFCPDQDAFNKCHVSGVEFPNNPYRFNYQWDGIKPNTIIKHFLTGIRLNPKHKKIRQWEIDKVKNILGLHNWDNDYSYFLKEKKKWKNK